MIHTIIFYIPDPEGVQERDDTHYALVSSKIVQVLRKEYCGEFPLKIVMNSPWLAIEGDIENELLVHDISRIEGIKETRLVIPSQNIRPGLPIEIGYITVLVTYSELLNTMNEVEQITNGDAHINKDFHGRTSIPKICEFVVRPIKSEHVQKILELEQVQEVRLEVNALDYFQEREGK